MEDYLILTELMNPGRIYKASSSHLSIVFDPIIVEFKSKYPTRIQQVFNKHHTGYIFDMGT